MPVESVQRAIDLLEQGRAEQAIPLLEDVVEVLPAYAGAYVLLARAYETGERWSRATHAWREALLLAPDSPVAAEGLRRSLRHGRRPAATVPQDAYSQVEELHRKTAAPETPREHPRAETEVGTENFDDINNLDRLIAQLEDARITPRPDVDEVPEPELEDDLEDMVSETLARIYAAQSQFNEAARVYDQLAAQHPERAVYFRQQAREMRGQAKDSDPGGR